MVVKIGERSVMMCKVYHFFLIHFSLHCEAIHIVTLRYFAVQIINSMAQYKQQSM